jgi:hypothetical protein
MSALSGVLGDRRLRRLHGIGEHEPRRRGLRRREPPSADLGRARPEFDRARTAKLGRLSVRELDAGGFAGPEIDAQPVRERRHAARSFDVRHRHRGARRAVRRADRCAGTRRRSRIAMIDRWSGRRRNRRGMRRSQSARRDQEDARRCRTDEREWNRTSPARLARPVLARGEARRGDRDAGAAVDRFLLRDPNRCHAAKPLDGRSAIVALLEVRSSLGFEVVAETGCVEQRHLEIGHSADGLHGSLSCRRHASSPK